MKTGSEWEATEPKHSGWEPTSLELPLVLPPTPSEDSLHEPTAEPARRVIIIDLA